MPKLRSGSTVIYFLNFVQKKAKKLIVYTDGASRGNPGPASSAAIIYDEDKNLISEIGEFLGLATNNEAEYRAVIIAFKKIKAIFGKEAVKNMEVLFFMDSELVSRQLNGLYKISNEEMKNLFIDVWNLKIEFKKVSFSHIEREKNKVADSLANKILDSQNKLF